ncbi:MAG TPA: conjugal transfer protein TraF [Aquabacterium sp.]|jgi:conjugal transfer pilus assembly protein TraF|uniref:conjugal transfer protein TraF n=1 Tax=Comamonadaceae TaxID=80864 RepID=UPI001FCB231C|nr:conjugal transfer protein TraF [Delftia lacustris]BDE73735.1 conjugal transfer protein TraF [Delftia lacustris]HQC94286.1 conjugal transfer protein TraF [Aquabacterium sp.]
MKNVLSRVLSIVLLSLAVAPLSGGALAQGSGALGVRDDSNPAYWSDRWRGWHFYEDPPQEEVEPPSRPAPSTAPRPTASPRPPELVEFERLQKTLEDLRNIAIMRPSEANVRRYMELEMQVVNRASYFADVAQRVAWATPDLDPSLQGRPVNAQALEVFERQQRTDRSASVANLGRDHVLFFFYRSDCPYCHAFGPTLQAFEARHGIQVVAVSVDGGPLPGFPRARPDNGIATALQVTQVPAVFLAQPSSGKIMPIGSGVLSESQLLERISIVSSPQGEAMLPSATRHLALP